MTGAAELLQRVRTPDAPLPGDDLAAVACTTELASVLHISPIAAPAALAQTLAIATHYPLDRRQTMTTTPTEAAATIIATLRCRLSEEPMPAFGTPELDRLTAAFEAIGSASSAEYLAIGHAAVQLLLANWAALLQSERATALAQIAAHRGSGA